MADEILWRAGLHPLTGAGGLKGAQLERLWRIIRSISRKAIKSVSKSYSALPAGWLFHQRWQRDGRCPRHQRPLERKTIGGRTTVWCPLCQPTDESPVGAHVSSR